MDDASTAPDTPALKHGTLPPFDPSRAMLRKKDLFQPFLVAATYPLRQLPAGGGLREETPVLVVEVGTVSLALLTWQMAYHHVAQGEATGKPWAASF